MHLEPESIPTLPGLGEDSLGLPDVETFAFNALEDISPPETHVKEGDDEQCLPVDKGNQGDIWSLRSEDSEARPLLRTWEAFLNPQCEQAISPFVSDAGPAVFDAVLEDTSGETGETLQSALLLKCLALLGQGRSSLLFQWDHERQMFKPTLERQKASGTSLPAFQSLSRLLTHNGNLMVTLRAFVDGIYKSRSPLATQIALARTVQVILEHIDMYLAESMPSIKSFLQLQAKMEKPRALLESLGSFSHASRSAQSDGDLIKVLQDTVRTCANSSHPSSRILEVVLRRVSQPWLQALCQQIGIGAESQGATSLTLPHSVFSANYTGAVTDLCMDQSHAITPKGAGLIDEEQLQSIKDAHAGIEVMRSNVPSHPILNPAAWGVRSPSIDISKLSCDPISLLSKAQAYELALTQALDVFQQGKSKAAEFETKTTDPSDGDIEQQVWRDDEGQQLYFAETAEKFWQPLHIEHDVDDLSFTVKTALTTEPSKNDLSSTLGLTAESEDILSPVWPYIKVQARMVNGCVLRMLFRDQGLRKHLRLQRDFHLFGNGTFLNKLTAALFSSEARSAERQKGTMIASHGLGLRLDARSGQRWPPASSELRLSLAGILSESYHGERRQGQHIGKDLPGGLSFGIRELSDAEIDVILDTTSVHALDFLRLRYSPSNALHHVITEGCLEKYDEIFRFLLQLVRTSHVATQMKASLASRDQNNHSDALAPLRSFAFEAYHILSILSSHLYSLGITTPWQALEHSLDDLEAKLAQEDDSALYGSEVNLGLHELGAMHDKTLDSIRTRLCLRRKQEKLKAVIERIFSVVLRASTHFAQAQLDVSVEPHSVRELRQLHKSLSETCKELTQLLHEQANKSDGKSLVGAARDDQETFAVLAHQLDHNGFYTKDLLVSAVFV